MVIDKEQIMGHICLKMYCTLAIVPGDATRWSLLLFYTKATQGMVVVLCGNLANKGAPRVSLLRPLMPTSQSSLRLHYCGVVADNHCQRSSDAM